MSFIQFPTLRNLAERTVHSYTRFIIQLAKFHHKSPDLLTPEEVHSWFFHLISELNYSAPSVNIAINAVHSFYGKFLSRDTHRVAITHSRLLAIDSSHVTFRYKDYKQNGQTRELTLPGVEFLLPLRTFLRRQPDTLLSI